MIFRELNRGKCKTYLAILKLPEGRHHRSGA